MEEELNARVRRTLSPRLLCTLFCGGHRCRYERIDCWPPEDLALRQVYSHWITEEIVAMARPNRIDALLDVLEEQGVQSVINLQTRFEHVHCAPTLSASSGFTYDPDSLMRRRIFFYNFEWPDFKAASPDFLLDAVKVLDFALQQGKVAVHCHAGLGRTGLLIACHLLFSRRFSEPQAAIEFVRSKRSPKAIQSREQIAEVFEFARALLTDTPPARSSLSAYIRSERRLLHGTESKIIAPPRLVAFVFGRLDQEPDESRLIAAVLTDYREMSANSASFRVTLETLRNLPLSELDAIEPRIPPPFLFALLFSFLASLDPPVLDTDSLVLIVTRSPGSALSALPADLCATLTPFISFLASICPPSTPSALYASLASVFIAELSRRRVRVSDNVFGDREWQPLGKGTTAALVEFFRFFREHSEKQFVERRKEKSRI